MSNKVITWNKKDEIDNAGYYRHGACGHILLRVSKSTNINQVYCYCRTCRKEILLENIENGKIVSTNEIRIKLA